MTEKLSIEEIIARDGAYVSTVSGFSMSPMLVDRRDVITVSSVCREIKKYDVILYRAYDKYVLHRVIKVLKDEYITCGDNCTVRERVPKESVVGILCEVWTGSEKLDLTSPEYLDYSRRIVSGYHRRRFVRGVRRCISLLVKKGKNKRR